MSIPNPLLIATRKSDRDWFRLAKKTYIKDPKSAIGTICSERISEILLPVL